MQLVTLYRSMSSIRRESPEKLPQQGVFVRLLSVNQKQQAPRPSIQKALRAWFCWPL